MAGFGSNKNGIFGATLDDPLHFNESGLFYGVTKVFYSGTIIRYPFYPINSYIAILSVNDVLKEAYCSQLLVA